MAELIPRAAPVIRSARISQIVLAAGMWILSPFASPLAAQTPQDQAAEKHTVAEWSKIALDETARQKDWETAHPQDQAVLLGAGQWVVKMYGRTPDAAFVAGTPEFIAWWKTAGAAGLEQWAKDDFPPILDRDHLIYNVLALYCAQNTPRTNKTLFVNGYPFSDPAKLWAYYDGIKKAGEAAYRRGFSGEELARGDYVLLRLYAPIVYCMWGDSYLPYMMGLTPGDVNLSPVPGAKIVDVTLPRLEPAVQDPAFTNAYSFDYLRPFHSEIAAFLLYVCHGYDPIPAAEQTPGGPTIKARPYDGPYRDQTVTISASRAKKPVLIILNDPIDGYWASTIPLLEPLYQATRDKIDWYFICDDICDNIFWNIINFPPNEGAQVMQKALSLEERARLAKNSLCMEFSNLSFPVVLDDMAQHAQNAFADGGGIAKVILIDKNGVVAMNSRLFPSPQQYTQLGIFGSQQWTQVHCVAAANVQTLLDHDGVWNGKPAVVPDWQPSPSLENAKITKVDANAGKITLQGPDGKDLVVTADKGTRVIFATDPGVCKSPSELAAGMDMISCIYEPAASRTAPVARLIFKMKSGENLNSYLSYPKGLSKIWCPAVVTALDASSITAVPVPRPESEMRGLKFWTEPGAVPITWEAQTVKDWIDHPAQALTLHTDRATEVILNGMKAQLSDLHLGDHLGIETRSDQSPKDLRPFFIFVYRYQH